jgi:hypothetical protein
MQDLENLKMLLISHNSLPFEVPFVNLSKIKVDITWHGGIVRKLLANENYDIIYYCSHNLKNNFQTLDLLNYCLKNTFFRKKRMVYAYSHFIPIRERTSDNKNDYQIDIMTFENGKMLPNISHYAINSDCHNLECLDLIMDAYYKEDEKVKKKRL